MKKVFNWFKVTFTDAKTALYASMAVTITSDLLSYGDSATVVLLSNNLGSEEHRLKVKAILEKVLPDFKSAKTESGRKAIAARIGAEIIRDLSGGKGKFSKYVEIFELFLGK